jgi:hypothetical protein
MQMPSLHAFAHLIDKVLPGYAGMSGDDPAYATWSPTRS